MTTGESASLVAEDSPGTWRAVVQRLWAPILLVLIPLGVLLPVVGSHGSSLSPTDEWVYFDYISRIPADFAVETGETVQLEARERMSCDGVVPYGPMGPACGGDYTQADDYPYKAVNSASSYTPIFFYATATAATILKSVSGVELLTAARVISIAWLIAGLLMFYALARRYSINKWMIVATATAFVASPHSWWTFSYLTTDSTSFAVGAALLLLVDRYLSGDGRGWPLIVVAALASALKITNILAVGLVVLILLGALWRQRNAGTPLPEQMNRGRLIRLILAVGAAAGAVQILWHAYLARTVHGDPVDHGITTSLGLDELVRVVIHTVPRAIVSNPIIAGGVRDGDLVLPAPTHLTDPLIWIVVIGLAAPLIAPNLGRLKALAWPVLIAALIGPALLAILLQLTTGYFPLPVRYGSALLPGALLGFVAIARSRPAIIITGLYAAMLVSWVFSYITSSGHI